MIAEGGWGFAALPDAVLAVVDVCFDLSGSNSHPDDWTARQPFTVVRITKDPALGAATHNVPFNKANEADCYLKFILDHYHDLPPRMIFAHGHEYAWHLRVRGVEFTVRLSLPQRW